ncbi:GH1 family beta-glucosidase [Dactylosporangium sp. CA-052675]|uniref:GH1 family beta-glucosidase n=1 Tax=Dactylosporangium sp. CA-052675 TaxID=3239927 RepID=UPI003D949778
MPEHSNSVGPDALAALPAGFRWGSATAAYQVEGAAREDGRGQSIWDTFSHTPGRTCNGDTGDVAADHYHRYPEDVRLMAEFGLNAYRFSISWPRILPQGRGTVNQAGLDHYDRVVDTLLEHGIEPMVTLFHWDLPQALEDEGGWFNRDTAHHFADYAQVVLERLADRVPLWLTHNEPWTVIGQGYSRGLHAPGHRDYHRAGTAIHHMLLGHGEAVQRFRAVAPGSAQVGITLSMAVARPWSDAPADVAAARLLDGEQNRVYLDPLLRGAYPEDLDRLFPTLFDPSVVRADDLGVIGTGIDFLGVNYYLNHIVKADPTVPVLGARLIDPPGPMMSAGIAAVPAGLHDCLARVHREYRELPMYVTEVGASIHDYVDPDGRVKDQPRIDYLRTCVESIARAVVEGIDVRGLYVWSLLDNLEWDLGYSIRFGLFYVDYRTQQRVPKDSAYWYRQVIAEHAAGEGPR